MKFKKVFGMILPPEAMSNGCYGCDVFMGFTSPQERSIETGRAKDNKKRHTK